MKSVQQEHEMETLESLRTYLDGLTARAGKAELRRRLENLHVGIEDVRQHLRFGLDNYRRNLVFEGDHYHLLIICWRSGQRSPIHNHAGSVCGLKVLTGVATETVFVGTPSGLLKPGATHEVRAGQIVVSQDDDIHQVSNLEAPETDLVTLHIYSPALLRMDTYSLMDSSIGEFRPIIFGFEHGSGI